MKVSLIFITIIQLCLFSCKEVAKDPQALEKRIPVIDLEKALDNLTNTKMNFSDFLDNITYVPLETNDNLVIGGMHQPSIQITKNYIFYGDNMFDRNGHFIRKLGRIGQGPGEYIMALGTAVDEERKEFYVLDNSSRDVYVYDFLNNFKKRVKLGMDLQGGGIKSLNGGKIMLERDNVSRISKPSSTSFEYFEYKIIDLDSDSILYTRGLDKKEGDVNCTTNKIWRYNDNFFYYEGITDSIFSLTKDGKIDALQYIIRKGKYDCSNEEAYIRISQIVESNSHLFFSVDYKSGLYYVAYNKTTGEIQANEFSHFFNNDIDGGFLWLFNNVGDSAEGYYSVLPFIAQERIKNLSKENKGYDKEKNRKLKQLIGNLEEDANPVFYFFHFK